MINMTTFSTLPCSLQAQSAAAELFTRIRNWKHLQTWSAGHRNTRSVFFGLQDFPEKQHTQRGRGMRGMAGKRKEMNGIFHLPAEIMWRSVCSRQHACAQRGSQFVCLCLCVRRMCRETPRQTDSWPGRQKIKERQRDKWLKRVEIVWTGLYNVFPAEPLLIEFWQTHAAKTQRPDKNEHYLIVFFAKCFWTLEVRDRHNVANTPSKCLIRQVELALPVCASLRGTFTTLSKHV